MNARCSLNWAPISQLRESRVKNTPNATAKELVATPNAIDAITPAMKLPARLDSGMLFFYIVFSHHLSYTIKKAESALLLLQKPATWRAGRCNERHFFKEYLSTQSQILLWVLQDREYHTFRSPDLLHSNTVARYR